MPAVMIVLRAVFNLSPAANHFSLPAKAMPKDSRPNEKLEPGAAGREISTAPP